MLWDSAIAYIREQPVVAAAAVAGAFTLVGYLVALLRQTLQSRAARDIELLRLRHQIADLRFARFRTHAESLYSHWQDATGLPRIAHRDIAKKHAAVAHCQ